MTEQLFTNLEFFNLLFDGSQISSHCRHVTQFDHSVVQVVKHSLQMMQRLDQIKKKEKKSFKLLCTNLQGILILNRGRHRVIQPLHPLPPRPVQTLPGSVHLKDKQEAPVSQLLDSFKAVSVFQFSLHLWFS